jgi:hypothetical protein
VAILHHNDSETPIPLRRLQPYTYDGRFPTICRLKKEIQPLFFLTLVVNKKWANVSLNLESLCLLDEHQGASDDTLLTSTPKEIGANCSLVESNKFHSNCSSKLLLGNFTLIFAIQGSIRVFLHSGQQSASMHEGETLVCERFDNSMPVDISMEPFKSDASEGGEDAILGRGWL